MSTNVANQSERKRSVLGVFSGLVLGLIRCAWLTALLLLLIFNARLYLPSPLAATDDSLPVNMLKQLAASEAAIENGAAQSMQQIFPEGYVLTHLFHGLSWIEVGLQNETHRNVALKNAIAAFAEVDSDASRAGFPAHLPPDHGMFYSAWRAHLLAGIVLLEKGKDPQHFDRLKSQCDRLREFISKSSTPFPASYRGMAWPCDTFPAIHAMVIYDAVAETDRYAGAVRDWLVRAKIGIDQDTKLWAHTTDVTTGRPTSTARATSQSIILRMLPDIAPEMAAEQYGEFRKRFHCTTLGLPSVREFPPGVRGGFGDVDSGPLFFGRSFSATVMSIGLARIFGDTDWATATAKCGEAIAIPYESNGKRHYAFGVLPIGEQMVAYSYNARPWLTTFAKGKVQAAQTAHLTHSPYWRYKLHLLTLVLCVATWYRFRKRIRKRSRDASNVAAQ